jgi:hypothetical protein
MTSNFPNTPWVKFILSNWLPIEAQPGSDDIISRAQRIGVIHFNNYTWSVNERWLNLQIKKYKNIQRSSRYVAFLVLGLGDFSARIDSRCIDGIFSYVKNILKNTNIDLCLKTIQRIVIKSLRQQIEIKIEDKAILQLVTKLKVTSKDLIVVESLINSAPKLMIKPYQYGLAFALYFFIKINAQAVGSWLTKRQDLFFFDAVLYSLQHIFYTYGNPKCKKLIANLLKSDNDIFILTAIAMIHTPVETESPYWIFTVDECFKIMRKSNVPQESSLWYNIFRIKIISSLFQNINTDYNRISKEYSQYLNTNEQNIQSERFYKQALEGVTKNLNSIKNHYKEAVHSTIKNWPSNNLGDSDLQQAIFFLEINQIWIELIKDIPSETNRNDFLRYYIQVFKKYLGISPDSDRSECIASCDIIELIPLVVEALLLLSKDNIGREFGNMFFGDSKHSLRHQEFLYEPYSFRKSYNHYHYAVNSLGLANYLALQLSLEGKKQLKNGWKFLCKQSVNNMLLTLASNEEALSANKHIAQMFSTKVIETLIVNKCGLTDEEIIYFATLPSLSYSLRSMLCWHKFSFFHKHTDLSFALLERSAWEPSSKRANCHQLENAVLAFDLALMTLAKENNTQYTMTILQLWKIGLSAWTYPVALQLIEELPKVAEALAGDKLSQDCLFTSKFFCNSWSALYLKGD